MAPGSAYSKAWRDTDFRAESLTKSVDEIARIIAPFEWKQYDAAVRPYAEGRGAQDPEGLEQFWYQLTWGRAGFRTAQEVDHWFRDAKLDGSEPCVMFSFRDSLTKARAILA